MTMFLLLFYINILIKFIEIKNLFYIVRLFTPVTFVIKKDLFLLISIFL